jgi:hypothetical protein
MQPLDLETSAPWEVSRHRLGPVACRRARPEEHRSPGATDDHADPV